MANFTVSQGSSKLTSNENATNENADLRIGKDNISNDNNKNNSLSSTTKQPRKVLGAVSETHLNRNSQNQNPSRSNKPLSITNNKSTSNSNIGTVKKSSFNVLHDNDPTSKVTEKKVAVQEEEYAKTKIERHQPSELQGSSKDTVSTSKTPDSLSDADTDEESKPDELKTVRSELEIGSQVAPPLESTTRSLAKEADVDNEEDINEEEDDDDDDDDEEESRMYEPMTPLFNHEIAEELSSVYRKFSRTTLDPNDEDTYDITMVAEYGAEIFNYMHGLEYKMTPNPRYMDYQNDISWENRTTLLGWMIQVHSRFNLLPETLYLAVNVMDRFLSKRVISLSRFQLCGAVALFLASKYEEINFPTVTQIAYMISDEYTTDDVIRAERFMVEVLKFEMGWPGPMSFLRRGSKADDYDNEVRTLSKYLLEITIMDPRFVGSPASWLAAGAQYLAIKMLNREGWTEAHVFYTGYTETQLQSLSDVLIDCCYNYRTHHNVIYEKYKERRFKRSSLYAQEWVRAFCDPN
ncbi:unnamed protein product [[Candida] boidinii]|uniref:Unnamed protein product n=1 Tax=Candida boidinii TaxID=5477 RepID=A0A9W6WB97_CANBO|nr:hypothetical protein B5S30_g2733 [[Candida] boidinii]OWB81438.1 hypothetical protein B5S33_g55 [[Candida] boidinii]GME74013.1 unnamed protein product [[Candida] boidinii]